MIATPNFWHDAPRSAIESLIALNRMADAKTEALPELEPPPETVDELAAGTDIQAYLALQRYGAHSAEYVAWNALAAALFRLSVRLAAEGAVS